MNTSNVLITSKYYFVHQFSFQVVLDQCRPKFNLLRKIKFRSTLVQLSLIFFSHHTKLKSFKLHGGHVRGEIDKYDISITIPFYKQRTKSQKVIFIEFMLV
jgi:hypothetical protein